MNGLGLLQSREQETLIKGRNPTSTETVSNFEGALKFFQELTRKYPATDLVYRGHTDASWPITPSLFRQRPDISEFESEMIRELVSLFPNEFINDQSMFDRLVRMQHYGLPTRLLDVTTNPLVALFFAVEGSENFNKDGAVVIFVSAHSRHKFYDSDVVSCMANLANLKDDERYILATTKARNISEFNALLPTDRLVQFIKAEKPYFTSRVQKVDLFRPVLVTPKRSNQRMHAQSGRFIIYGLESEEAPVYEKNSTMVKLTITHQGKVEIRNRLDALGIDASTMFPEIDKASKRVVQKYASRALPF